MEEKEETESTDIFDEIYKLGLLIFSDDAKDIEKGVFHTKEEVARGESPIHHWPIGLAVMFASALGKVLFALESSRQAFEVLQQKV